MTLSVRDIVDLAANLRDADQAERRSRCHRLGGGEARAKPGPLGLVTAADGAAERRIVA